MYSPEEKESKNQPKCNHQWKKVAQEDESDDGLITVCERCGCCRRWPKAKVEDTPKDSRPLLTEG